MSVAEETGRVVRLAVKSPSAFRTIAEVAGELDLPPHVLRFWESKFPQVKPLKRRGGRRYYRPEDVSLLRRIRALLYRDGYTIKGAQRLLKEGEPRAAVVAKPAPEVDDDEHGFGEEGALREELQAVLMELEELRALLRRHGF
jgi:DNA-binding transcriptional MerR regulator